MLSGDWRRQLFPLLFYKLLSTCERDDRSLNTADVAALSDGDVITSHSLNYVWVDIQAPNHPVDVVENFKMSPIIFQVETSLIR